MSPQEKILDRVRKLHRHAESASKMGSKDEAEAFAARVAQMMAEYKLEMSDLEMSEMEVMEPVGRGETLHPGIGGKRVAWVENLAATIADAYFCRILVITGTSSVIIVGRKTDRQVVEYMLEWMIPWVWQLSFREMKRARIKVKKEGDPLGARGFRTSFLNGFVSELSLRFWEAKQEMEAKAREAGTGTALVRLDDARKAVRDWMEGNIKGTAKSVGQRSTNRMGYLAGRKAGREVNLNRPIESGMVGEDRRLT